MTGNYTPEYGKQCQACFKKGDPVFARRYWQQTQGIRGKHKNVVKWRRLCRECWQLAQNGKI